MIPRDIFCDKQTNICPQLWKYVSPTDIYSQQRESVYCNTIRFLGYVFMSFNIYSSGENSGIYTLSNNIRTWLGCALFSWWRHQMETFAALSVLCKGNSPVTVIICNAYPQRCVVRGIALSSLLSCWLLANLNSRGSSVAPTWAHLCWPGSRSVHGSIHSCTIGWPHLAWRGHPKYCLGCLARSRRPPSVNES